MFIISEPRRKNEDTEEAQKRRKQRAKKRKQQMQKKIEENKVHVKKEFKSLQKMFVIHSYFQFLKTQTVKKLLDREATRSRKEEEKV